MAWRESNTFYFLGLNGECRAFIKLSILFYMPEMFHSIFKLAGETKQKEASYYGAVT
jgi:hypothetical protein